MKNRYHQRRGEAFSILGGACVMCGSIENLEIDHRERGKKVFDGTRMTAVSHKKFLAEIKKCQLLCNPCHIEKTVTVDYGRKMARGTHGTLSSYRYCRCELCKGAKRKWNQIHAERYNLLRRLRRSSVRAHENP